MQIRLVKRKGVDGSFWALFTEFISKMKQQNGIYEHKENYVNK